MDNSRYELFDRFVRLSEKVRGLNYPIQNEAPNFPDEPYQEWIKLMDECADEIENLRTGVKEYYNKTSADAEDLRLDDLWV